MTDMSSSGNGTTDGDADPQMEAVQRDIEQTRERLADTVDQLTAKLDVKTRAAAGAKDAKARAQAKVFDVDGKPRPAAVAVGGAVVTGLIAVVLVKLWGRRRRASCACGGRH